MATPALVKQVLENGNRNYVALFTAAWDSGHVDPFVAVALLDPTSTGDMGVLLGGRNLFPGTHLKIWRMQYDCTPGLGNQLLWDATSAQTAYIFNGDGSGKQDFMRQGGLFVPQSAGAPITGATGKILMSTLGTPAAGNFLSLNIWCKKDVSQ